jgi:hypothetical protein
LPDGMPLDPYRFGVESCRPILEIIIEFCHAQKLIPRRISVDELFTAPNMRPRSLFAQTIKIQTETLPGADSRRKQHRHSLRLALVPGRD